MKGKTFTETQIVKILKDLDSGKQATDVARENGSKRPMNHIFIGKNAAFTFDGKTNQNGSVKSNVQISKGMA